MDWNPILVVLVSVIVSGIVGYMSGTLKLFKEQKLRAYEEVLPAVLKAAYGTEANSDDEKALNRALVMLWLYARKDVAKEVDRAVSMLVVPDRGDKTEALQIAIAAMRKDIQIWSSQSIEPKEILHLYLPLRKT